MADNPLNTYLQQLATKLGRSELASRSLELLEFHGYSTVNTGRVP